MAGPGRVGSEFVWVRSGRVQKKWPASKNAALKP